MASNLERLSDLESQPVDDERPSPQATSSPLQMRPRISGAHPENEQISPDSRDEAPEEPHLFPDVDAICQETRAKMQQARLKADQLICHFAEAYVATAGQLREDAIQQYHGQLEGLPAELCAKVCETLAKDDIFCCNMEFGNGHLSYGGMSFTYKAESVAAFNALSHHAWKDLDKFVKDEPASLSGDTLDQGRLYGDLVVLSDDEDDEVDVLEPSQDGCHSSSEENDSSCDDEGSLSSSDASAGTSRTDKSGTRQDFDGDDDDFNHGSGKQALHGLNSSIENTWTPEQDQLLLERMQLETRSAGAGRVSAPTAVVKKELAQFLDREEEAIVRRWLFLSGQHRSKGGDRRQKKKKRRNVVSTLDNPESRKEEQAQESSSRLPRSSRLGRSEAAETSESGRKIWPTKEHGLTLWSPEEVAVFNSLTKGRRKQDIDFEDIAARLPGPSKRSVKACMSFFWRRTHGQGKGRPSQDNNLRHGDEASQNGPDSSGPLDPPKPPKKAMGGGTDPSSDSKPRKLSKKARFASQDNSVQYQLAQGTLENNRRPNARWTQEEDDILWRLAMSDLPWRDIAAQIPLRSESACWSRYDAYLVKMPRYLNKRKGRPGRPDRRLANYRQAAKSDAGSPVKGSTEVPVPRKPKRARETGDENERRSAASRKRHRSAQALSPSHQSDDDEPEAEESDVYMRGFE